MIKDKVKKAKRARRAAAQTALAILRTPEKILRVGELNNPARRRVAKAVFRTATKHMPEDKRAAVLSAIAEVAGRV